MATPEDLRVAFEAKLKDGVPTPPGDFYPSDLERVKDDKYLKRVLLHQDNDIKQSVDMLWDIFSWRKTMKTADINEGSIKMEYILEGAFFPRGRDVDGHLLLVFKSKLHIKGQKDLDELKRCVIYWFDRVEREEHGKPITLFFDMEGCGLGNMDMELTKFLINLMKLYYPYFLHYIIIYQMPWVLSAAFKIIKQLLPAKAVEKMKFVTRDSLKEFVTPEQALVSWGGKDDYIFEFIPESHTESIPKKVTFAEQGDQHSPGEMLRFIPGDVITFKNENEELTGQFQMVNMDESAVSFKIRTTSPEKFRVRPSSGTLAPKATQSVTIVVQPGFQLRSVTKDRFLVMSVQVPKIDMTPKELTEVWQKSSGSKVDEYRLKCVFPEKEVTKNGNLVSSKFDNNDSVTNALNNMQVSYESLNLQVRSLKVFQILTLILTFAVLVLALLMYKQGSESNGYCERM